MSCNCATETTVSIEKSYGIRRAIARAEPHDLVRVRGEHGVARLEHTQQRAAALGADRAVAALVPVHPAVDDLQGFGRVVRLVREDDDPDRRGDLEPFAFLGEVRGSLGDDIRHLGVVDADEDAELVAAQPVGPSLPS